MLVESTICTTYLSKGSCPLGNSCPKRHVPLFQPPPSSASHNRDGLKRTVCKHWLRGLCKKGDGCDYLHEYDMRTMPECRFFATFGFCDQAGGGAVGHVVPLHHVACAVMIEGGQGSVIEPGAVDTKS